MSEVKRVVILGYMGSGKTSLFNLITQQQERTRYGGESVTQLMTIGYSNYLSGFEIIDTPGFSPNETIVSLAGIFVGLFYGHINRILLVVKYDRVQFIMRDIKEIFEKIQQIKPIITIVVTHWDLWQQRDNPRDQEIIISQIKRNFEIESVLFLSNKNDTRQNQQCSQDICNKIEQILLHNDQVLTFRVTGDVLRNLGLTNQEQIELVAVQVQQNFRQITQCFQHFLNNFNFSYPNVLDILHQLQLDFKQKTDNMLDQFVQQYGNQMNDEFEVDDTKVQYFYYIYLKSKITIDYQSFLQQVQEKMMDNNIQSYSFIKRCPNPNCKLIWIKVSGCDGKVYCGQLSNSFDLDQQNQIVDYVKKYQFVIINNQLNLEEQIHQTDEFNSINLIKKFVIENNLIQQSNQEQIIDIVKSKLSNFKDKIIFLKEQYKTLMQQREEHQNNIFYNFNELAELYRDILEHYCIIFENQISNDRNNVDSSSMSLRLISEEDTPQYVVDCSFLNLSLDEWLNQINSNLGESLSIIKQILKQKQQNQLEQISINSKLVGCKKSFIWKDQPPISRQELLTLFSQEVLDYLSDPNRFIADENNQLDNELKQIFNVSLNEGMKKVKILQNIQ